MTSVARSDPPRRKQATEPSPAEPGSSASPGTAADGFGGAPDTTVLDDDPTQGEWLFKQDDVVLGPVTAIILVEKLKKGELSGDTPIARDGQPFRPMKLLPLFRDAWMAAEREKRLAAEERAHRAALTRVKILRALLVLAFFIGPFTSAAAGTRALLKARPWDDTPRWIAKVPPLVDLPQKPPEVKKAEPKPDAPDAKPDVVADATAAPEDDERDPKDPRKPAKKPKVGGRDAKDAGKDAGKDNDDEKTDAKPSAGLPETLTTAQALEPLKTIQSDLKACFKAEMESNSDMPMQVVLSYTITEEGKAINIALDARELRGRPVVGCVQKAMGTLKFPRFTGERKNVSVPFKLGKPPQKK